MDVAVKGTSAQLLPLLALAGGLMNPLKYPQLPAVFQPCLHAGFLEKQGAGRGGRQSSVL